MPDNVESSTIADVFGDGHQNRTDFPAVAMDPPAPGKPVYAEALPDAPPAGSVAALEDELALLPNQVEAAIHDGDISRATVLQARLSMLPRIIETKRKQAAEMLPAVKAVVREEEQLKDRRCGFMKTFDKLKADWIEMNRKTREADQQRLTIDSQVQAAEIKRAGVVTQYETITGRPYAGK